MKMIKPLADRVAVKPDAAQEKTSSGLIVPEVAKKKQKKGTVVAVGPGTSQITMSVKEGDHIAYGQYAGTEITVEGVQYVIMKESDIYAIL